MNIDINSLKKVLPLLAVPFLINAKCNKDNSNPCRSVRYSFAVTSNFSPQKEIYNIGDTIYLNSSFPKKLLDAISNQEINYSNSLGVGGNLNFIIMDSISRTINYSTSSFAINSTKGQFSFDNNSSTLKVNITYLEDIDNYEFKASIKLLSKGLFYFVMTDLSSQGIRGQNCTNAGFGMTVTNSNKNLHLFQNALGYAADAMLVKNIYCFRVQ